VSTPVNHADAGSEIAAEQSYVTRLYDQLDTLRARTAKSLDDLRRSPIVPTPAGRAERDAFDALHSERLRQLSAVEDRLCFGRLDLAGGIRRYIGRTGLSDDAQAQLLVDWRAPAAAAFYQATPAAPDGVVRRRHIAPAAARSPASTTSSSTPPRWTPPSSPRSPATAR
jgi:DNA helicase IV